ncbi:hypothetical protein LshimejAT787_1203610 [Lyophyllum shimeji]|uniref:Uncharacterized protein n=1 Tax=Lyophyllum shimeji TaxID=47721 RepID=A0A9P3US61_LYOSH|nr:hypothetical protein LshimejAT787_1203610 [Lyophyllum shimeji]
MGFVEEETAQTVEEQGRGKEFDQMMAELNETFATNQQRRERLFREADALQQEVFQKNEPDRETVFLDGQTSRAALFEAHEASRAQRSEWHNASRETLLQQGRQRRKEACDAIEAALVKQFNKLLKSQEDSFVAEERRRDIIVQKLLEDDKRFKSGSPAASSLAPGSWAASSLAGYSANGSTISFPNFVPGVVPHIPGVGFPIQPPVIPDFPLPLDLGLGRGVVESSSGTDPDNLPVITPSPPFSPVIPSPPQRYQSTPTFVPPPISPRSSSTSSDSSDRSRTPERNPRIQPTKSIPNRQPRARRSPSPPFGFAAKALFRGVNIQRLLPLPGSDFASTIEYYASTINLNRQGVERSGGSKSGELENFEEAFRKDVERRRHIFSINEARRKVEFERKQRAFRMMFAENEDGREDDFRQAQSRQEIAFQAAEQKRAIDFRQEENEREAVFRRVQEQRATRFHTKQEDLQRICFEGEQRRSGDLDSWATQLLRNRKREQMEIYKNQEGAREETFRLWLATYAEKDEGASLGPNVTENLSTLNLPGLKSFSQDEGASRRNNVVENLYPLPLPSTKSLRRDEGASWKGSIVENCKKRGLPSLKSFRRNDATNQAPNVVGELLRPIVPRANVPRQVVPRPAVPRPTVPTRKSSRRRRLSF